MTKSGCCWHQFSDYIIRNNKPFPIKIVEEKYESYFVQNKIKEWNNGKYSTKIENIFFPDELEKNIVLRVLLENGKTLYLLNSNGDNLYYFYTNNNLIEMMYSDVFFYSKKNNSISFTNKDATYKIFNNKLKVDFKNKVSTILFSDSKQKGNISDIYQIFKEKNVQNLEITD